MAEDEISLLKIKLALADAEIKRLKEKRDVYNSLSELSSQFYERCFDSAQSQYALALGAAEPTLAFFQGALESEVMLKRRQYWATFALMSSLPASLAATVVLCYLAVSRGWRVTLALLAAYALHIYSDAAPKGRSRSVASFRKSKFGRSIARYFPLELRKSSPNADFDPESVYMFGYHPHGVISIGCFMQFAFDATGANAMFPGLRFHCATLSFNFLVPFFREVLLSLGVIEVSAHSIKTALRSGPGAAVVIVPGGASEALDARPGTNDLTLNKRNGFFRIALQHGAKLVPVYSFGENELYDRVDSEGSRYRVVQDFMLSRFGYSAPMYLGAGSSPNAPVPFSPVPRRHPVITVVGDPIPCPTIESPTQDDIDAIKVLYIEELRKIFETFADKYAPQRTGGLRIVK